ncbi:hypothetical protein Nepgr_000473 [Nepenthes gracilis]|uniref:Uncharacterized protein n=1 Tax=Nepenthes gracilis TaxID=150966 RepID=A0AAD3P315_NEPGR|nr:hypothetical protein Nepgr_000473 [Nepenthes gracilis]
MGSPKDKVKYFISLLSFSGHPAVVVKLGRLLLVHNLAMNQSNRTRVADSGSRSSSLRSSADSRDHYDLSSSAIFHSGPRLALTVNPLLSLMFYMERVIEGESLRFSRQNF